MLYSSAPHVGLVFCLVAMLLTGCGGSTAAAEPVVASTAHASNDFCGPKITYYQVTEYELSPLHTGAGHWQDFRLLLQASALDYLTHAAPAPWLRVSLFANANACPPSFPATEQTLASLQIISNDTFSADYPAGHDVTALFQPVLLEASQYTDSNLPASLSELVASYPMAPQSLTLALREAPAFEFQSFTMIITLTDGNRFSVQTGPIALTF